MLIAYHLVKRKGNIVFGEGQVKRINERLASSQLLPDCTGKKLINTRERERGLQGE